MEEVIANRVHPDFARLLSEKPANLQSLFSQARDAILGLYPDSNELLYHTHALSAVYSVSTKLKHAFCHIAVYTNHMNLGFNAGTELDDPERLLKGTGAKIRHVAIRSVSDLNSPSLLLLIERAVDHALADVGGTALETRRLLTKIK